MRPELILSDCLASGNKVIDALDDAIEILGNRVAKKPLLIGLFTAFGQIRLYVRHHFDRQLATLLAQRFDAPHHPGGLVRRGTDFDIVSHPRGPRHKIALIMDATVVRDGVFRTDTGPLENGGFPAKRMTLFEMTGLRDGLPDTVGGCLDDMPDTHALAQLETP